MRLLGLADVVALPLARVGALCEAGYEVSAFLSVLLHSQHCFGSWVNLRFQTSCAVLGPC